MLIAKQKRNENIIEYILYLYQIEDMIRALKMDMELIETKLVAEYQAEDKELAGILDWYANLTKMMEKEGIREKGHLQIINNLVADLNEFHIKLLETSIDKSYVRIFQIVAGLLTEIKQKNLSAGNQIQLGIDTIYGYLLLKVQKKTISAETTDAVKRISIWFNLLSKLYKDYEAEELVF